MRWNKLFSFILILLLIPVALQAKEPQAKDIQAQIKLAKISAIKTSEQSGDEIFLDITQYSNLGPSRVDRIPPKPEHWPSKTLSNIKDLVVWSAAVKENEEIKVILSVVEQDNLPWDLDELIGSAQVVLKNNHGTLETTWSVPVFEEKVEVVMEKKDNPQGFIMKGDNSHYAVSFSVDTVKEKPTTPS